ncbi:hypothetical protein D8B26_005078 [Coccidioides posadasii str. Silveira]|uniref:Predicted protein n=1 Tax=Coccidioides posadasii (strain RMSCC 757 / Silveira) TaxID=443226 RepID=E9D5Q8_COCPS|nr:predicted protein [Coccidioides posadasii str. Silveira]QVM10417.1 hypothetical protein D8B26_005078 [Coccidioides posadasii str. Silveira]
MSALKKQKGDQTSFFLAQILEQQPGGFRIPAWQGCQGDMAKFGCLKRQTKWRFYPWREGEASEQRKKIPAFYLIDYARFEQSVSGRAPCWSFLTLGFVVALVCLPRGTILDIRSSSSFSSSSRLPSFVLLFFSSFSSLFVPSYGPMPML